MLVFPVWVAAVSIVILGAGRTRTDAGSPAAERQNASSGPPGTTGSEGVVSARLEG